VSITVTITQAGTAAVAAFVNKNTNRSYNTLAFYSSDPDSNAEGVNAESVIERGHQELPSPILGKLSSLTAPLLTLADTNISSWGVPRSNLWIVALPWPLELSLAIVKWASGTQVRE
jgi:hypothetical protein